jgi:sugar phosphate isomerase/epimerase
VTRRFGISTHLFHSQQLCRDHLTAIAAHGFSSIDLFATRSHFDYHRMSAVDDLNGWLGVAGLELHAIHAPVGERYQVGRWSEPLSLASDDPDVRARALAEAERALYVARRIPAKALIVHLGMPRGQGTAGGQDGRGPARRSIEALARAAEPLGIRVALEVIQNELSRIGSLVHFVETDLEGLNLGICLDVGHARLDGDLLDAIDTAAEHIVAVELHDNRGRQDEHLVPLAGTIDWPAAMTFVQKVGYDGTFTFEIGGSGSPKELLGRAAAARERIRGMLAA